MMDKKDDKTQVEIIKQQIDEVLKNLESIKNQTSNIQSASEVCLMATIVSSFQEASRIMEDRGISIDAKTICELSRRYAQ